MRHALRALMIGTLVGGATAFAAAQSSPGRVTAHDDMVDRGAARSRFARTFPDGRLLENQGHLRRVWGRRFASGPTPADSAESFMRSWSELWGVPFSQLVPVGPGRDGAHLLPLLDDGAGGTDFTLVYWSQQVAGIPVFRSFVWGLVGNEPGHPLVLAGGTLKDLADFAATMQAGGAQADGLMEKAYASAAMDQFGEQPQITSPRLVIWAGVDAQTVEPRVGVEFTATAGGALDPANYRKILFVIDADTGAVLHQENQILNGSVSVQVNGLATPGSKAAVCATATTTGMPYAKVTIAGTTQYTNASGGLSFTYPGTSAVTVAPELTGLYFVVNDQKTAVQTVASAAVPSGTTGTFQFPSTTNEYLQSQIDTYVGANVERDFVLSVSPAYPTIATETGMPINNGVSGTCNAYYDGSSINFFSSGGGCNNTGFSSVVFHEYGHHMVSCAGSGQAAYGEGFGDVMSLLMLDEHVLGYGFQNCSSGIRDAQNTCVGSTSGSTCGSEIHAWGQVLSGCVWDMRNQYAAAYPTDFMRRVAAVAINQVPLHAGQSDIWKDITIDYLALDDAPSNGGDNDLTNGTPNATRIEPAFAAHGLAAPLIQFMPGAVPNLVSPSGGDTMLVQMTNGTAVLNDVSPVLMVREVGQTTFASRPMTNLGDGIFQATFPPATVDATLEFYFQALTQAGVAIAYPDGAPVTTLRTLASYMNRLSVVGWGSGQTNTGKDEEFGQSMPQRVEGIRQIEAGWLHGVAVKEDGAVIAWGDNTYGQCAVPATLLDAVQVAAGDVHTLALRANGTVVGWGSNGSNRATPPSGLTGVVQVAAGGYHSAAVKSNGTVSCWGSNGSGQSSVPAGLSGAAEVACGGYHTVARRAVGTVTCWGYNGYGQRTPPADLTNAAEVAAGWYHSAALRSTGTVTVWGYDGGGAWAPPADLQDVKQVACGDFHTVALTKTGQVVSWGWCVNGSCEPPTDLTHVRSIAASGTYTLAQRACEADFDASGQVDFGDVMILLSEFGPCLGCAADLDGSNAVDFGDLQVALLRFGPCM